MNSAVKGNRFQIKATTNFVSPLLQEEVTTGTHQTFHRPTSRRAMQCNEDNPRSAMKTIQETD